MASVSRRGTDPDTGMPVWRIRVNIVAPDGRRRYSDQVVAPNITEARRMAREIEARVVLAEVDMPRRRRGRDDFAAPAGVTLVEAVTLWLEEGCGTGVLIDPILGDRHRPWAATTRKEHRRLGNRLVDALGADTPVVELDLPVLARWREQRLRTVARSTVDRETVALRGVLTRQVVAGTIDESPADRFRRGSPPTVVDPDRVPTTGEVSALLAAAAADPDGLRLLVGLRLAAVTGARRASLLGVRWRDLALTDGTVDLVARVSDAGPGEGLIVETGRKTDKGGRVPLDADTVALLTGWRDTQAAVGANLGVDRLPADGHVLGLAELGWAPPRPDSWTRAVGRLRKRSGLPDRVMTRTLRHAAATRLLAAGVDPLTVADRLGHADPAMTLRAYAAVVAARRTEAADRAAEGL